MASKMITGARELVRLMSTWIHRGDDRRPGVKDIAGQEPPTTREEALKRLKKIYDSIGQRPAGRLGPAL